MMYQNPFDIPDDDYVLNTGHSSDSTTPLSFKEWQALMNRESGQAWNGHLYLRDVNVWISIYKTDSKPNPIANQPDLVQYMVDLHFKTAKYQFYQSNRDGKSLEQKQQAYHEERQAHQSVRLDDEDTARRAGFTINESYQDPDMWQYIIEPAY